MALLDLMCTLGVATKSCGQVLGTQYSGSPGGLGNPSIGTMKNVTNPLIHFAYITCHLDISANHKYEVYSFF